MIKTALVTELPAELVKATAQILAQNNYKIILCTKKTAWRGKKELSALQKFIR
jgi:hypothetical protein